jgi:hypothetical protein
MWYDHLVAMMIPLQLPTLLRPSCTDPKQTSIHYSFSDEDIVEQDYHSTMYRIPYSPETFWTHFQFTIDQGNHAFQVEIFLITANGESHTLVSPMIRNAQQWYDTCWPLPSVPTSDHSGLYLRLIYPKIIQPGESDPCISLSLLGFLYLFPSQMTYLLYHEQQCKFVFLRGKNSMIVTSELCESIPEYSVPVCPISEYLACQ